MKLKEAYEAHANDFIKEEVEYFQEEFGWPLAQCLTHVDETASECNDRKTINLLNIIYIDCGRLQPVSDEEYEGATVMGGRGTKAGLYPKIKGQRYRFVQTDQQFEEANEK